MHMSKGFTLIETLLSLLIVSFCSILFSLFLQIATKNDYNIYVGDDERSIHQMRLLFALSKNYEISNNMLYLRYLDKDMNFNFDGKRLILEDGYQVYFMELTSASFMKENDCYYFNYQRNKQTYRRVIGCE